MEKSRRDLLKYFGIGATIVPVLGGTPVTELPAKLIQEPKLDLVKPESAQIEFTEAGLDEMYEIKNGQRGHIKVEIITADGHKFKLSGATDFRVDYMSPLPPYRGDVFSRPDWGYGESTGFVDTARRVTLNVPPVVKWSLEGIFIHPSIK